MLQITVDIFSGRPNPTLVAEGEEEGNLLQQIARDRSAISAVHEGFQGLGYRGLIVETLSDNIASRYNLPDAFRVAGGLEIAERVLSSLRKATAKDEELYSWVVQEIQHTALREETTEADHSLPPAEAVAVRRGAAVTCWIELGPFNPGFWNDPAHIGRNNCYNYASNRRTDTFAQPGRATGHQATVMACANVTAAALSDGLHHRFDCFPDSEKPRWLMALVVAPNIDYHWYRKQKEGFWGHKPGGTAARNVDNNGAIVWNPETAARYPYTNFCGYFYACKSQKIS
jgi:hypothetical protein